MRKWLIFTAELAVLAFISILGPTGRATLAGAAVQHQQTSGFIKNSDTVPGSITWSHTVGAGTDLILIVTTAIDSNYGSVVSAVTYDGQLLTRRTEINQGFEQEVQLWYLLDPPVGTYPVTVEYDGQFFGLEARASTYSGVSQNRPISAAVTTGGAGTTASVAISSASGELVIDALGYHNTGTMAAGASQNERFNTSSDWTGTAGSDKAGAASVTMSWSLQNNATWAMAAASLRPAQSPSIRTVTVKPSGGDYTSLNAALAGEADDLVSLNRQLNIELYAMTDTTAVDLVHPGYTTDPDHFIRVYTPASQRHAGVRQADQYNLDLTAEIIAGGTYPACFNIGEVDLWLDGIQAVCSYSGTDYPSMIAVDPGASGAATLRVSNSIFKGNWTSSNAATNANFIVTFDWPATSEMWVWNTIATDFWWADQTKGRGLHSAGTQGGEIWWSNVTLANLTNAASLDSSTHLHVRNSLAALPAGGASWIDADPGITPDSDYNASNLSESLVGGNSLPGSTFTFRGADDWRLAAADTGAQDNGADSFNSFYTNNGKDVAGNARTSFWDIGAAEYIDTSAITPVTTASPPEGYYPAPQIVTLTTDVPAKIYYTTDGSTPTTASPVYGGEISIGVDTTLKYFAAYVDGNTEAVNTDVYVIDMIAPTTTAAPAGGTYTSVVDATLTADEPAAIYYTTDGSTPTTASTVYSSPISIAAGTTLKYFAVDLAGNNETVKTQAYIVDLIDPTTTASPAGGYYNSVFSATLTADEPATIYYTTDGSTPTTASAVYSGAIPIAASTTLQYFAKDTAGNQETVQSQVYVIDLIAPASTASPAGGTYAGAVSVTLTAGEPATIYYTTDGSTPTTASAVYSGAINISADTTLKYFAVDLAGNIESVNSAAYTIQAPQGGGGGGGSGCFITSAMD